MSSKKEIEFNKYKKRGSLHWREMISRDPRVFNAFQQGRYDWIIRVAGDLKDRQVLDIGSGDGSFTYMLAKNGAEVVGIDNEELGVQYARENLENINKNKKLQYTLQVASAYNLPFPDESFDIAVCCDVIEHLNEPEKMLQEAARVLKKGGKLIITTPYRMTEKPQDINHIHEYYPEELKALLQKYFPESDYKLTHHLLWRMLYAHTFRYFGNRPLARWVINLLVFCFGWNPFMIPYDKKTKFDAFSNICIWGIK